MTKQLCIHCYISGRVQGVWFRASAKEQADHLAISGYARNLADGRVEVLACGDAEKLEKFYTWLQQGPQHAKVSEARRENVTWQEHKGFSVL